MRMLLFNTFERDKKRRSIRIRIETIRKYSVLELIVVIKKEDPLE